MQVANCPYTKISNSAAAKTMPANPRSVSSFSLVPVANAQAATGQNPTDAIVTSLNSQLTVPFYIFIVSFFLFIILMSCVYMYHWMKFNLNDPFIKNFTPIYFVGLVLLTIPLIFNLLF